MTYYLSKDSLAKLEGVHPKMRAVVFRAIEISLVDFKVIEGVRTPARQKELYAQGRTKPGKVVTWTLNSKHFIDKKTGFGHAVDLLPAPYDWQDLEQFKILADAMRRASKELKIPIRHGADWDGDGVRGEKGENDWPHFELIL